MAKLIFHSHILLLFLLLTTHHSKQVQPSQSQSLLKIQQILGYPLALSSLNCTSDFCDIEPTTSLTIVCYEDNLTQLHINGQNGFPQLPKTISTQNLFTALSGLSNLKVLSLASLGLWGQIPQSIGELGSLEILNLSSNHFSGSIPVEVSTLRNLQSVVLDDNQLTGQVPSWFSSLSGLAVLSLKNNFLNGSLPFTLNAFRTLRILSLSRNNLSGEVPDLHNLRDLQVLDLENNYFGPHFPSLPNKLVTLLLRNNSFRLGIPSKLSSFYQLQKLDLSLNEFIGPFLPSLLSLPSITYLDVSANRFTGMLFRNMSCNAGLMFVNLSSNLLRGKLPICLKSKSKVVVYARNCLSYEKHQEQHPSRFCHNEALAVKVIPHKQNHKKPFSKSVIVSGTLGGTLGGLAIVGMVLFLIRRRVYGKGFRKTRSIRSIKEHVSTVNAAKLLTDARYISETMKMGASLPAYRTFALEELKEATNNFEASCFLGEGSHGEIYRGKLPDGTHVTIRSLKMKKRSSPQTYMQHIELISKLRHCHVVSALGHCFECHQDDSSVNFIYLIFEFVPNGTLRDCVSGPGGEKLSWSQRIVAAIGVVKGVQFLHTGIVPGIYSNALKITDVLKDSNHTVKISSYNLPLLSKNQVAAGNGPRPKGNVQARVKYEDKNDVYDIGVILLEIILGRPIMFCNEVGTLKDLLQVSLTIDDAARRSIVDPAVHKECSEESLKTMMEVCVRCLSSELSERPSVEDVLWNLQFAAQVQINLWRRDSNDKKDSSVSSFREM